ncbi:MAG TPA: hypothetical protein VGA92_06500 [Candidatus Nitrosotenuis sp.]|jgi:hypothetical protein
MSVLADLKTAIPLAGSLALYFYFKPSLSSETLFFFFGIWISCFALDAKITVSNPNLINHEKNIIFPILYRKFGPRLSPIIQLIIEVLAMALVVSLFERNLNLISMSVVSLVFGLAHLDAYLSNIKTIRNVLKD